MAITLFAERRQQVLKQMEPGSVLVLAASRESVRNADVTNPFRQNSDFVWLTGFVEPDAVALLIKDDNGSGTFVMFVRAKDPEREVWDGRRAGPEGAVEQFGATEAFELKELDDKAAKLIANRRIVYHAFGAQDGFDKRVMRWLGTVRRFTRLGATSPEQIRDPRTIMHPLRLHKSGAEIDIMRRAGAITREAHKECMRACKPGLNERHLVAVLDFVYRKHGSDRDGYNHIVAGGVNACVLHYNDNNQPLVDGEVCLIDSGCELEHYAADITSTFPVNGTFTPAQAKIYTAVLAAQKAAIAVCTPGTLMEKVHEAARDSLIGTLLDLKVIDGKLADIVKKEDELLAARRAEFNLKPFTPEELPYRKYYPHGTGHWLGLDVHDVGAYRTPAGSVTLQPGMVLTVEPGLYFQLDDAAVPKEFRGIGVRIEDDILITPEGYEILTAGTPRTLDEVHATCAEKSSLPL
ncbi:MAG: aminopeptidase P N-terminal domain-containing protein [Planctomycetota bacterium]